MEEPATRHPIYDLPNWWVANCELSEGDPHYNSEDHLSLPYRHVYFMDVMSFFDFFEANDPNHLADTIEPILLWMSENLKGHWRVCSFSHSTGLSGGDVRVQLWFSFDSAEDAMLSRMTWPALRLRKHANT